MVSLVPKQAARPEAAMNKRCTRVRQRRAWDQARTRQYSGVGLATPELLDRAERVATRLLMGEGVGLGTKAAIP